MPELDGIAVALIVAGVVLAVAYPLVSHVRLFLALPRTPFGRGAAIVGEEAFACILILSGIIKLLGSSPLFDLLNGARTIIFIIFALSIVGGGLAEATNPDRRDPGSA